MARCALGAATTSDSAGAYLVLWNMPPLAVGQFAKLAVESLIQKRMSAALMERTLASTGSARGRADVGPRSALGSLPLRGGG